MSKILADASIEAPDSRSLHISGLEQEVPGVRIAANEDPRFDEIVEIRAEHGEAETGMADDAAQAEFQSLRGFGAQVRIRDGAEAEKRNVEADVGVLEGRGGALDRYLAFLRSGGNAFPIDQLKSAGVDMNGPEAIDAAMDRFGALVEDLESLVGSRA